MIFYHDVAVVVDGMVGEEAGAGAIPGGVSAICLSTAPW